MMPTPLPGPDKARMAASPSTTGANGFDRGGLLAGAAGVEHGHNVPFMPSDRMTTTRKKQPGRVSAAGRMTLSVVSRVTPMVLLILAGLLALAPDLAAGMTHAPVVADIVPHAWEMDSITTGDGSPVMVADPERYTAQFLQDGRAVFRLDCTRGQAMFTASAGHLALTDVEVTDAHCPAGSHAGAFGELLRSAETYRFDVSGNLILGGSQGVLRFRPGLADVQWQWQGIAAGDGQLVVAITTPERYTLEFLPGEALAIRADCNRARARVRLAGRAMAIRPGAMTRMACQSSPLNDLYLTGLHHVEQWHLVNGVLTLSLQDGMGLMLFNPVATTREFPSEAE